MPGAEAGPLILVTKTVVYPVSGVTLLTWYTQVSPLNELIALKVVPTVRAFKKADTL